MNVFVVMWHVQYEDSGIVAIFSTKEAAEAKQRSAQEVGERGVDYWVDDWEVDESNEQSNH